MTVQAVVSSIKLPPTDGAQTPLKRLADASKPIPLLETISNPPTPTDDCRIPLTNTSPFILF